MSETSQQTKLLPFPPKYQHIDNRYRFAKRAKWLFGHFNQLDDYPLRERKYLKTRWYYGRRHPRPAPILQQNVAQITEKVVPDVVLLNVFKYLHPMDLINGASRVSRRWNQLSRSPSLYRYVRVLVNQQSAQSGSAMEFLQRTRNHIRKLSLIYANDVSFVDVFPDCMPNVTTLDITSFPEVTKCSKELVTCFPSVEELIMPDVGNVNEDVIDELFSSTSFKHLRVLNFFVSNDRDEPANLIPKLCESTRPLQVLRTFAVDYSNCLMALPDSPICETLTHLTLFNHEMDVDRLTYVIIGRLTNLVFLSFDAQYGTENEGLMCLKRLYKLEHLHLHLGGEYNNISYEGMMQFFALPSENASQYFPYRLRYLSLSECDTFRIESAKELVKSCPQLISLNISANVSVHDDALTVLVKNLPNLRFLDLSRLDRLKYHAIRQLSDDDLPQLQFLNMEMTRIRGKHLRAICLKRPQLWISHCHDHIINWDLKPNGKPSFNRDFDGDINLVLNDLNEIEGFCCMESITQGYLSTA